MLQARFNIWLENEGKVVMSPWRVQLLEAIDETGSISAAAEKLNIPYRRAWEKVQEIEAGLGMRVLETTVGGSGGGGARLTAVGRSTIQQFRAFVVGLDEEIAQRFTTAFYS